MSQRIKHEDGLPSLWRIKTGSGFPLVVHEDGISPHSHDYITSYCSCHWSLHNKMVESRTRMVESRQLPKKKDLPSPLIVMSEEV